MDKPADTMIFVDTTSYSTVTTTYRWQEERFFGPDPPADNPYVPIDIGFVNNLWVPDVYIYHLKSIEVLDIFIPFAGESLATLKMKDCSIHCQNGISSNNVDTYR